MNLSSTSWFWAAAPMGIFLGAIRFWRWRLAREGKRVPVAEKMLRPPGEYLRCVLQQIDDDLIQQVGILAVLAAFLPLQISGWPKGGAWSAQCIAIILMALIHAGIALVIIRILRLVTKRRAYQLGFSGERLVGEHLNQLMLDGCRVFHDLPANGIGNIDHVVVAPTGIYAVETKTRRKGPTHSGQPGHRVVSDGKRLHFPDGFDESHLRQAERSAKWLSEFLTQATGEPIPVTPILTLPGWLIERTNKHGTSALNHKNIRDYIFGCPPAPIPAETIRRIVADLDRKCRNVAFR